MTRGTEHTEVASMEKQAEAMILDSDSFYDEFGVQQLMVERVPAHQVAY